MDGYEVGVLKFVKMDLETPVPKIWHKTETKLGFMMQ